MAEFMFALLGFPVVGGAGFLAKWFVLKAALQAPQPQITLAVVLVLTTVISAGYYLYVVMVMFMRPRTANLAAPPETPAWTQFVMVACAAAILIMGIMPEPAARLARVGRPSCPPTCPSANERPTAQVDPALLNPANLSHAR
jgi:NADH-quinone oxidoreductase subunit N